MHRKILSIAPLLASALLSGCGSGSSNGSGPPPASPPPSFTLSLSVSTINLSQGGPSQSLTVSIAGQNGFSDTVTVAPVGLFDGISVSPSSLSLTTGMSGTFSLSASSAAPISDEGVNVKGTTSSSSVSQPLTVNVSGVSVPDPFHNLGGTIVHGFYDEPRNLLFASNPGLNEVDVLSGSDMSLQARVPVPQPWGIDQMADAKTLVIGTQTQQIVTLDEDTLTPTAHPYAAIGGTAFSLYFPNVVAMANGKVLIIGMEQGIASNDFLAGALDGGQYIYEWDSIADQFGQLAPGASSVTSWEVDSLARSADHQRAAFSADKFYLYESASGTLTSVPLSTVSPNTTAVSGYAISSDGSKIAVANGSSVTFFDRSFNQLGTVAVPATFAFAGTTVQFSTDGSKLFLQYITPIALEIVDAINYIALGYTSPLVSPEGTFDRLLATDSSERGFVGISGGVRVLNLAQTPVANPSEGGLLGPIFDMPASSLPLNSSRQITLPQGSTDLSCYLGGVPAPFDTGGTSITVPASSQAGSVDAECIGLNGNTTIFHDQLSFGVVPIGISANLLPSTGAVSALLAGFGFSATSAETPTVSVGGQAAPQVTPLANFSTTSLQGVSVVIPKGAPGNPVDIVVNSSLGSGTLDAAATYYGQPTIIPGSGWLQLLFDTHRNLLYALKPSEIDVLNATNLQWDTPISLPSANYALIGISPDGTYLVAVSQTGAVSVIDPDQPSNQSTVQAGLTDGSAAYSLAITKYDKALIPAEPASEIDLATLAVRSVPVSAGILFKSSADGSALYGVIVNSSGGEVYSYDPVSYIQETERFGQLFWTDLAVAPDGSHFAVVDELPGYVGDDVGIFDAALRQINLTEYPDASPPDDKQVLGSTYSPQGQIVVVPLGDSIEFWDAATATLRARLMTPEELRVGVVPENPAQTSIAIDAAGQTIFALSASGLTVIPLPGPIDALPTNSWQPFERHTMQSQPELSAHQGLRSFSK